METVVFTALDCARRRDLVRRRVGQNDLAGAANEARALGQAAAGEGATALERACRRLCQALAPDGSAGASGLLQSLKALDQLLGELSKPRR